MAIGNKKSKMGSMVGVNLNSIQLSRHSRVSTDIDLKEE